MALIWDSPGQNLLANTSLGDCTSPSFTYPMTPTPLILSRDWPDNYYPSADDFNAYEFQSNHLDPGPPTLSSLTGLGIINLEPGNNANLKEGSLSTLDMLGDRQIYDRRPALRTPRIDSVYNSFTGHQGEVDSLEYPSSDVGIGMESSWSFSSVLKAAEQATSLGNTSSFSSNQNLSGEGSSSASNTSDDLQWAFEKLSKAAGLSVAELTEATLRRLAESSNSGGHTLCYTDAPVESSWLTTLQQIPQPLLLPTGVKARSFSWNNFSEGVNPADIVAPLPSPSPPASASGPVQRSFLFRPGNAPLSSDSLDDHSLENSIDVSDAGQPLDNSTIGSSEGVSLLYLPPPIPGASHHLQASEDEPPDFQSPSSSEYSPPLRPISQKKNARRISRIKPADNDPDFTPSPQDYQNDLDQHIASDLSLGTPVLDAHRGVDIEVLKAKAERYRLRNQGRDYDKRWLISFAGKLSARGELIEEFRCYVTGCKQFNKRRDHILIHVGAHLDQRPFKCTHCPARFLRKNECKRHELSHTGIRPFTCSLCPSPATTFVRQDLLKRHMKRTHRMDVKAEKENDDDDTYRPRKRARY